MFDKALVTPLGRALLNFRKEQLKQDVLESQEELVDLNQSDPGDGFQDGFVLDTQMNIQMMQQQLRLLTEFLADAADMERPEQTTVVALGHRIRLRLIYPYDESEELIVVLIPSQELSLVEAYLANGEVSVSPNSALGTAILGRSAGSTFTYDIDAGSVQGEVLEVEIWQHAFNLEAGFSSLASMRDDHSWGVVDENE